MLQGAVLISTFLTVVLLVVAIYQTIFSSRLAVLDRLDMEKKGFDAQYKAIEANRKGMRGDLLSIFAVLGKLLPRRFYLEKIQRKLIQAHLLLRADEFVGLSLVSGVLAFILIFLFAENLLLAILGIFIGFMLPNIYVNMKKKKRSKQINQQLPEALNIIANGLRAGYSFPQAMDVVSREMEPPITEEFGRVIRENRLGKPMEDVLNELSERTNDEDMDIFVTALIIQKQVGGNLAVILNNIEHTIRERVRIKGEINAITAQQRLSAVIIVLLPVGVGVALFAISPDYMSIMFQEVLGWAMLGGALVLQVLGIFIIRKVIQIEV